MPTQGFIFCLMVIMTTLFSKSLPQTACGTGWFGTGCKYKCWCPSNRCDSNGECVSGTGCVISWFGPGCQYRNIMSYAKSNQILIKDEEIGTCNPGTPIITVDFDGPYYFTWLRIIFNVTALSPEVPRIVNFFFKDIANDSVQCTYKTVFNVDPSTVDIHCILNTRIKQIILHGNETLRICELFVNGGRNIALKQQTNQSSTLLLGRFSLSSDLAVDGSRDGDIHAASCTHTRLGFNNPTWFLHYPRSAIIERAVLYNRNDVQERLKSFTLQLFDANSKLVQYYQEPGFIRSEYRIQFLKLHPVDMMSIQTPLIITLCEVETMGDYICPRLKWGLDCLDDCHCTSFELCSPITGKCNAGCSPGFFGRICEINCPTNCLHKQCVRDTGICVNCEKGYMGNYCVIECLPNIYGSDCLLTCHSNCMKRDCGNRAIGAGVGRDCSDRLCDQDGLCNACIDPTRYGMNCTMECPKNCHLKRCDSKDGACYSCKTGFYGNNCSQACSDNCKDGCDFVIGICYGCKSTFYGHNCALQCPITCTKRACHTTNGTCIISCQKGFYGEFCSNHCPKMCKNQTCHVSSGYCLDGCQPGFFWTNCSNICPTRCKDRVCDFTNGSCYSCEVGYYGVLCDLRCPDDCTHGTCNILSGACSKGGDTDYRIEFVALISVVVVLFLIATLLLWRRKSESGSEEVDVTNDQQGAGYFHKVCPNLPTGWRL